MSRRGREPADGPFGLAATPAEGEQQQEQQRRRGGDNALSRRERGETPRAKQERRIEQRLTVVPGRAPSTENRPDLDRGPRFALPGPTPRRARPYGTYISFVVAVVLPIIVASIYYGFIASNLYVAEFRFAV
jgi:hypothetical protein